MAALAALLALGVQQAGATTVRVHYPAGKEAIRIVGDKGPMSWSKGVPAQLTDGPLNVWTYTWPDALGEVQMKPTLGEDKVSIGGAYRVEMSDFYNMSYLQSNSSFSAAGGLDGPSNRFDIYGVRLLRVR